MNASIFICLFLAVLKSSAEQTDTLELTTSCEPPENVQNLKADTIEDCIYLTWDPPLNVCEQTEYDIYIDQNASTASTSQLNYNITDLNSCVEYTFAVAARFLDQTSDNTTITKETPVPEKIAVVEDYTLIEVNDGVLNATWKPPEKQAGCITGYELVVVDQNSIANYYDTDQTYYEIKHLIGCMKYQVVIKAKAGVKESTPQSQDYRISDKITNPPTIYLEASVGKTWTVLYWQTDSSNVNMCEIKQIEVACVALESENDDKNWIKWTAEVARDVNDNTSRPPISTNITGLSEFTNYTCLGRVINTKGPSDNSTLVKFQTNEEVPSSPQFLLANDIAAISYNLQWEQPYKIPGVLQSYGLALENITPNHFIPSECRVNSNDNYYYELQPDTETFNFATAHPNFHYEVRLNASTRVGYGTYVEIPVNTLSAEPEMPRNLNHTVSNTDGMDYNASAALFWMLPCNTNGILSHFNLKITATANYDDDNTSNTTEITVPANADIENVHYKIEHELKASHEYTISIRAIIIDGPQGEVDILNFTSPVGYPGPPDMLQSTEITTKSFKMHWTEPDITNGKILHYRVVIKSLGPIYEVPSSEGCNKDLNTYTTEVDGDRTHFNFRNALPHHAYEVSVVGKTTAGYGVDSSHEIVKTLQGEPEVIRNVTIHERYEETEAYDTQVNCSFLPPCHTYGIFEYYQVVVIGQRKNYDDYNNMFKTTNTIVTVNLLPEYNYTIKIVVTNSILSSNITSAYFVAPAGVPKQAIANLEPPETIGADQAIFTLPRKLFDEVNGNILYYALIIGEFDSHESSTYGHWHNNEETWPWQPESKTATRSYQLTPIFWNPFQGNDLLNVTIHIGNGNYSSNCNKPLEPETKYAFKVRGFTARGYRDSEILFFQTDPLSSTKLAVTLGAVFGTAIALALISFIFVLWRRRKSKITDSTSPIIIKSDLPSAVPIKRFLKHYEDIQLNYNKLKSEYTVLNNKSREVSLTTNAALLPENRKKNRYSNILPYDETRVKLSKINNNASDYINASYIIGHCGYIEYIATQGPLESTCSDFWTMVVQENVTIITMLAQFIEQNKNKCFKYFPNNHENMELENGIEVRCATEIYFGNYTTRTLYVKKDLIQKEVTHVQFMDWPDFGCPSGTNNMLQFCQNIRDIASRQKGKILVHCSAGVGRTGTFIAIDMLLRDIKNNKDVDIFGKVLKLRCQRTNMVQTEKQYMYIHTCIRDFIENPTMENCDEPECEHIYDNIPNVTQIMGTKLDESAL